MSLIFKLINSPKHKPAANIRVEIIRCFSCSTEPG
jgi:hypothetical protein